MGLFKTKKYSTEPIDGLSVLCLTGDWEKDSVSIFTDAKATKYVTWIEDEQYLCLASDARPVELSDKVEEAEIYVVAFNKKEYEYRDYSSGNGEWKNRQPTELERYITDFYSRNKEVEPPLFTGQLVAVDISKSSIKKAQLMGSSYQVFNVAPHRMAEASIPFWANRLALRTSSGSKGGGGKGGYRKTFSELAEEKLQWLSSVDTNLIARALENVNKNIATEEEKLSLKDVIFFLGGQ